MFKPNLPKGVPIPAVATGILASLALCAVAVAFTVTKNVNSGKPPVEKFVIFEKGKPAEHLTFKDTAGCKTALAEDGSIEIKISGFELVQPEIRWKAGDGRPATFDVKTHQYVVLTCRLEGNAKQTLPNGKISETRADNLWFSATLINQKGERVGLANLADVAEDAKTPAQTVTLNIPMLLFKSPNDGSNIEAIGFFWDKTRPNIDRDFKLVIDKIALADEAPAAK